MVSNQSLQNSKHTQSQTRKRGKNVKRSRINKYKPLSRIGYWRNHEFKNSKWQISKPVTKVLGFKGIYFRGKESHPLPNSKKSQINRSQGQTS